MKITKCQRGKNIQMTSGKQKKLISWKPNGNSRFIDDSGKETEGVLQLPDIEIISSQPKQNWFTRATLGAMIAENPAVAAASGWIQDSNGDYIQKPTKESEQLATHIATLSTFSPTNPSYIIGNQILKGIKTAYKITHPILPTTGRRVSIGQLQDLLKYKIGEGAEALVIDNSPTQVAKITSYPSGVYAGRDKIPHSVPLKFAGYVRNGKQRLSTFTQKKLKVINEDTFDKYIKQLDKAMSKSGFRIIHDPLVSYRAYTNGKIVVDDVAPGNIGLNWRGKPKMFDFAYQSVPEWIDLGYTLE